MFSKKNPNIATWTRTSILLAMILIGMSNAASAKNYLPLRRGIYVDSSVLCEKAVMADLWGYYGDSIAIAHDDCSFKKVRKTEAGFVVNLACTSIQSMEPYTVSGTYTVLSRESVKLTIGDHTDATAYRWCVEDISDIFKDR